MNPRLRSSTSLKNAAGLKLSVSLSLSPHGQPFKEFLAAVDDALLIDSIVSVI